MSIFDNWTPKQRAALERATAKLRKKQIQNTGKGATGHKGIYWDGSKSKFVVYTFDNGCKVYCGTSDTIEGALTRQATTERKLRKR